MWMKVATAGSVGAIIVGAGVAALASNSGSSGSGTAITAGSEISSSAVAVNDLIDTSAPAATEALGRRGLGVMRHFQHGEWVARGTDGTYVTHDAIKGTVTAVSATSIAVKAADGFNQTYTVDSDTAVRIREHGKGSGEKGAISQVKPGDRVLVAGVKSGTALDAKHVVDVGH